jgi:hypothetical protein
MSPTIQLRLISSLTSNALHWLIKAFRMQTDVSLDGRRPQGDSQSGRHYGRRAMVAEANCS